MRNTITVTECFTDADANADADAVSKPVAVTVADMCADVGKYKHVTCEQRQRRHFPAVNASVVRSSSDLV